MIDFKEIPKAHEPTGTQDTFELFARDFLSAMGFKIIKEPTRGYDGGQGIDIIIEEERTGKCGKTIKKWAVSCKHKAHSGNSITNSDEPDIIGRVTSSRCDGFIGFYSMLISSALDSTIEGFRDRIEIYIMSPNIIEGILTSNKDMVNVFQRYFPKSYLAWMAMHSNKSEVFDLLYMPSFTIFNQTESKGDNADRFYDGYVPTINDLSANFDVQRDIYTRKDGIQERLTHEITKKESIPKIFLINGVGGTGKTTLLKRIAYDLSEKQKYVLWLNTDWRYDSISVQAQIKYIISTANGPIFLFMDDFSTICNDDGIDVQSIFELYATSELFLIISDTPDRWNKIKHAITELVDKHNFFQFNVNQLSNVECERLLDKMYYLEEANQLTVKHLIVDKDERMQFYLNETSRHLVVIMYQLRYGAKFENIIIREYQKLVTDGAKKGYELISLASIIGLPLPESILIKCCYSDYYYGTKDFCNFLLPILNSDKRGYSARHPVIARIVSRHVFTSPSLICNGFKEILSSVESGDCEAKVFVSLFLQIQNIHKRIVRLLKKDVELIRSMMETLMRVVHGLSDNDLMINVLIVSAMCERNMGNNKRAFGLLLEIVSTYNSNHSFALRQLAWVCHDLGEWGNAAHWAVKSAAANTESPEQQFTTARLLSLNTVSNFKLAKKYFERALSLDPSNRDYINRYEEYMDAEKILQYFGSYNNEDMIPGSMLETLRPGLSFFKIYYGINSKQTNGKLIGVLSKMEEEFSGSVEDLKDIVEGVNIKNNKVLYAKYLCNMGRLLYLDWYNNRQIIDVAEIENIFRESIRINGNDPFCHCWLGTYYKEVVKDYTKAKIQYEKAVLLASKSKYENETSHPIFENNLGLLLLDSVRFFNAHSSVLNEARQLFLAAVEKNTRQVLDFHWASRNLEICDEMLAS